VNTGGVSRSGSLFSANRPDLLTKCLSMLEMLHLYTPSSEFRIWLISSDPDGKTVILESSRTRGTSSLNQVTEGGGIPWAAQLKRAVCPIPTLMSSGSSSNLARAVQIIMIFRIQDCHL